MTDIAAVAYPHREMAEAVRRTLTELMAHCTLELDDAVIVTRDDKGKIKLHQTIRPLGTGAPTGAMWGGLITVVFVALLMGTPIDPANPVADGPGDDPFIDRLRRSLTPGGAALILLGRKATLDRLLPHASRYGGEVIQCSLDVQTEAHLRQALRPDATACAPGRCDSVVAG